MFSHPSTHVKRERTERKTSRLQAHQQPHQEGLALCLRVILDSGAHRWVQAGHPRYTGASTEEGRGWPDLTSTKTTNDNRRQVSRRTCLQRSGVDTHLYSYTNCAENRRDSRVARVFGRRSCDHVATLRFLRSVHRQAHDDLRRFF